jgi:hypothetical protein
MFLFRSDKPFWMEKILEALAIEVPRFVEASLLVPDVSSNVRGDHFFSILGVDRQNKKVCIVL